MKCTNAITAWEPRRGTRRIERQRERWCDVKYEKGRMGSRAVIKS